MKLTFYQDTPGDLKDFVSQGESIKQAFALVAEHGVKTLNRYKTMMEG